MMEREGGGLSAIFSAYGGDTDPEENSEEEEVIPVGVFVKFGGGVEKSDALIPTDFRDVRIKEEEVEVLESSGTRPPLSQQSEEEGTRPPYEGQSYSAVQVKEEPASEEESEDSEADSCSSSNGRGGGGKGAENSDSDGSDADESGEAGKKKEGGRDGPKVKGEMSFKDLPLIEDLHISVPHEECKAIGVIKSVVDPLVVVEAFPATPALDIDSVLFLDFGDRTLGKIFDVIGPVKQPFYCVRFNSLEHIQTSRVEKGMLVYCAPATPHTSYVFLAQLRKLKGSDASWLDDIEPPTEEQEFSDDDAEKATRKKGRRGRGRKVNGEEPPPNNCAEMPETFAKVYEPPQVPGFRPSYRRGGSRWRGAPWPMGPSGPHPPWMMHQQMGGGPSYPSMGYPPLGAYNPYPGAYPPPGGYPPAPNNTWSRPPSYNFYRGPEGSGGGGGWGPQTPWPFRPQPPPPPPNS